MNLQKIVHGLKKASDTLSALEAAGIDVDRLVGISNAQGPQAKVIKSILSSVSDVFDPQDLRTSKTPRAMPLKSKKSRKGQKALPPRT